MLLACVTVAALAVIAVLSLRPPEQEPTTLASPAESAAPRDVPSPDADQTRVLLDGLRDIDPALGGKRSVLLSMEICGVMLAEKDGANGAPEYLAEDETLIERTRRRFGSVADINRTEAGRIVRLVQGTFCHR